MCACVCGYFSVSSLSVISSLCPLLLNGLCVVRDPFIRYHKNISVCVCVISRAAVWSSYVRCVLKVTVSRGYDGVRVTEELQGMC